MPQSNNHPASSPVPERFQVSRSTLLLDRFMTVAIRTGGLAVVVAVLGIFVFIGLEVVPLFAKAKVVEKETLATGVADPQVLGVDEWGELPFVFRAGSGFTFVSRATGEAQNHPVAALEGREISALGFDPDHQRLVFGTAAGEVGSVKVEYAPDFSGPARVIRRTLVEEPVYPAATPGAIRLVDYGDGGANRTIVTVAAADGGAERVEIMRLAQKRTLLGKGEVVGDERVDVTERIRGRVQEVDASGTGDIVLVVTGEGWIYYFYVGADGVEFRQEFQPFGGREVAAVDYLLGGVSALVTASDGEQRVFSLYRKDGLGERTFGEIKSFPPLAGPPSLFSASQRNRLFLTGSGRDVSLRYSTTADVRWSGVMDFAPVAGVIDAKNSHIILADQSGNLRYLALTDEHPAAGWRAYFGKIWYEGASAPSYEWQSTGGSDEFEPKLSLVPLIFGTLKGTLYAMLIAVPVALSAAVFSASYLPMRVKRVVKPMMELMASMPSVVLGFLAGLWLAPLIQDRVPSVMLALLAIPVSSMLIGWVFGKLPVSVRARLTQGHEWLVAAPLVGLAAWLGWMLGPGLEEWVFVYQAPGGERIGDFRLWWPQFTGTGYDQRNSLVVGFMMGFAVIPVIFTIAEDAIANVPRSLTAAASALGATRWQVVRTVSLPIASAGIFSALMIGLGRAVGETMIMVMATGNTPLMEWNIFSGMRTLSANIAVELPEAPEGSTHYATLFLGAIVLFALTFVLNSIAEVLRQRLREKYKLV